MACIFGEVDLLPTWHPLVPRSAFLALDAEACAFTGVLEAALPWPLPRIGAVLDLQADIDRLANDGVFHVDATTDTEIEKTRLPPWARKLRLVPIDGTLAIRFTPVRGGTKLEIRYAIDFAALPPLPFAPKRAIDWLFFIAGPLVWGTITRMLSKQLSAKSRIGARRANDSLGMWSRIRAGVGQEAPHWIAAAREDPKCEDTERVVYEGVA